jgi:hypothetical protein
MFVDFVQRKDSFSIKSMIENLLHLTNLQHLRCRINHAYFHFYIRLISTKSAALRLIFDKINKNLLDILEKFGMIHVVHIFETSNGATQSHPVVNYQFKNLGKNDCRNTPPK